MELTQPGRAATSKTLNHDQKDQIQSCIGVLLATWLGTNKEPICRSTGTAVLIRQGLIITTRNSVCHYDTGEYANLCLFMPNVNGAHVSGQVYQSSQGLLCHNLKPKTEASKDSCHHIGQLVLIELSSSDLSSNYAPIIRVNHIVQGTPLEVIGYPTKEYHPQAGTFATQRLHLKGQAVSSTSHHIYHNISDAGQLNSAPILTRVEGGRYAVVGVNFSSRKRKKKDRGIFFTQYFCDQVIRVSTEMRSTKSKVKFVHEMSIEISEHSSDEEEHETQYHLTIRKIPPVKDYLKELRQDDQEQERSRYEEVIVDNPKLFEAIVPNLFSHGQV